MREQIQKMFSWLCAAEKRMLAAACGVGLTAALVCAGVSYAENAQAALADEVVRLHILANSDADGDQAVKLLVRDALLPEMNMLLAGADDKESACSALTAALPSIAAAAEAVLRENGYDYSARASIARAYFPTREYGEVALPAGPYDALRIELGAGAGRNWWCMVFPPLCYVEVAPGGSMAGGWGWNDEGIVPYETALEAFLSEDGAALVTRADSPARIRFKLVELWQEWKEKRSR